jgi:hypothetical protein
MNYLKSTMDDTKAYILNVEKQKDKKTFFQKDFEAIATSKSLSYKYLKIGVDEGYIIKIDNRIYQLTDKFIKDNKE